MNDLFRVEIDEENQKIALYRGNSKTQHYLKYPEELDYKLSNGYYMINFGKRYNEYEQEVIEEEFHDELKRNDYMKKHPAIEQSDYEEQCEIIEMELNTMKELIPNYKKLYHVGQIERARRANIAIDHALRKLKTIIKEKKKEIVKIMIRNGMVNSLPSYQKPREFIRQRRKPAV